LSRTKKEEGKKMIDVKVPELAESIAEASLLEWQKQRGEEVREGDLLVSVETDKIVMEVYAPASGVLAEIIKSEGEEVAGEELIARIDETATGADDKNKPADKPEADKKKEPVATPASESGLEKTAMPSARKLAAESGVSLGDIDGSGKGGRVTKGDVIKEAAADKPAVASPAAMGGARGERRVAMTRLRAKIAERLLASQQQAAILTTFNEVNMSAVIALRAKYRERFEKAHGCRLGFMSFFVKAVVHGLRQYPIINAAVDGGDIVYHEFYDIGVAVASPRGLVVPIVRDADMLSFAGIEKHIADFGARAQEGKLGIAEISGGTFSISNGGVFGSMLSTPIINPPQSAILGVHATKERPIADNGEIVIRPMNYLALSYDHRIIDGREAVLFLAAVKDALEDPARLALEV
jgi:2-oxoglutarate dehydrogenase E2 component (dihydrolipoamide succinyltransferase)